MVETCRLICHDPRRGWAAHRLDAYIYPSGSIERQVDSNCVHPNGGSKKGDHFLSQLPLFATLGRRKFCETGDAKRAAGAATAVAAGKAGGRQDTGMAPTGTTCRPAGASPGAADCCARSSNYRLRCRPLPRGSSNSGRGTPGRSCGCTMTCWTACVKSGSAASGSRGTIARRQSTRSCKSQATAGRGWGLAVPASRSGARGAVLIVTAMSSYVLMATSVAGSTRSVLCTCCSGCRRCMASHSAMADTPVVPPAATH